VRIGRIVALAATLAVASCGGSSQTAGSERTARTRKNPTAPLVKASIVLRSGAFAAGGAIPRIYTCDGRGSSPPVRWSGVPGGTRELTLEMRDPDAPGGNFIHWALAGIAPTVRVLRADHLPPGVVQGDNSSGSVGYTPPCPPSGDKPHRYVITVVALARPSGLRDGFDPARLPTAGLATGTLIGTYARG
jgi:Raf kinase inhibitor-like YbhB/YbcL family protein